MKLLTAAIVSSAGLSIVGYGSYAVGLGRIGFLLILQTGFVFGSLLWYCATSWPKWYRKRHLRIRILSTYAIVLSVHILMVTVNSQRLRFEWGMWVWAAASMAEIFVIAFVLTAVVVRAESSSAT